MMTDDLEIWELLMAHHDRRDDERHQKWISEYFLYHGYGTEDRHQAQITNS